MYATSRTLTVPPKLLFISDPAKKSSPLDFVIGSWIHCKIPTGASINITSISCFLNSSTKAPNFMLELIQSSPTSLVLILDLPHRKDFVLHPDYLKRYYQDTGLDSHCQSLFKLPEKMMRRNSNAYEKQSRLWVQAHEACASGPLLLIKILGAHSSENSVEQMVAWVPSFG